MTKTLLTAIAGLALVAGGCSGGAPEPEHRLVKLSGGLLAGGGVKADTLIYTAILAPDTTLYPKTVSAGLTLTSVTQEDGRLVFDYTVDENELDFMAMKRNREHAKAALDSTLQAEPVKRRMAEVLAAQSGGLAYRFTGSRSKKKFTVVLR